MPAISLLLEELPGNSLPATSGQPSQQKAKWLYELERAQWGLKQRPQTLGHNLASSNLSESVVQNHPTPAGTSRAAEQEVPQPTRFQSVNSMHSSAATNEVAAMFFATDAEAIQQTATIVAGQLLPVNPAVGTNHCSISSVAPGITLNAAQRHWDKQRTHMEKKDDEIRLWLRDTRISTAQGLELAMALRKRFAELGLTLARFTLNGQVYDQLNSPERILISDR